MLSTTTLPSEILTNLGSESMDFAVKAARIRPLRSTMSLLFFSLLWLTITGIFLAAMFGPILVGQESHFTSNGVPVVAGPGNLRPLLWPGIFMSVFVLVGVVTFGNSIYSFIKKGGYFVGTPSRLVYSSGNSIHSIDWEQFSGDIVVQGNAQKGDISLQMRTGQMVSRKNGPSQYVPDTIYICGIPNASEIEALCRKRIKENDPTPPAAMRGVVQPANGRGAETAPPQTHQSPNKSRKCSRDFLIYSISVIVCCVTMLSRSICQLNGLERMYVRIFSNDFWSRMMWS